MESRAETLIQSEHSALIVNNTENQQRCLKFLAGGECSSKQGELLLKKIHLFLVGLLSSVVVPKQEMSDILDICK